MRLVISTLFAVGAALLSSAALAQSADVESTIKAVDVSGLAISLSDGKTYNVPQDFNFDDLAAGQKVNVFYTVVDGKRVIDDLIVVE